jgi:hypothetical protein
MQELTILNIRDTAIHLKVICKQETAQTMMDAQILQIKILNGKGSKVDPGGTPNFTV